MDRSIFIYSRMYASDIREKERTQRGESRKKQRGREKCKK